MTPRQTNCASHAEPALSLLSAFNTRRRHDRRTFGPFRGKGIAMDAAPTLDPILRSFREALAELYGPALDRVVLFGSRARGDAGADSDYDVAVFLNEIRPGMAEWYRLADLRTR